MSGVSNSNPIIYTDDCISFIFISRHVITGGAGRRENWKLSSKFPDGFTWWGGPYLRQVDRFLKILKFKILKFSNYFLILKEDLIDLISIEQKFGR